MASSKSDDIDMGNDSTRQWSDTQHVDGCRGPWFQLREVPALQGFLTRDSGPEIIVIEPIGSIITAAN